MLSNKCSNTIVIMLYGRKSENATKIAVIISERIASMRGTQGKVGNPLWSLQRFQPAGVTQIPDQKSPRQRQPVSTSSSAAVATRQASQASLVALHVRVRNSQSKPAKWQPLVFVFRDIYLLLATCLCSSMIYRRWWARDTTQNRCGLAIVLSTSPLSEQGT